MAGESKQTQIENGVNVTGYTDQIDSSLKVTAYTIVSGNWRVFENGSVHVPELPDWPNELLNLRTVTADEFKGVQELNGGTGILITFPNEEEVYESVHLLITGVSDSDGSNRFGSFEVLKGIITRVYYDSMRSALEMVYEIKSLSGRWQIESSEVGIVGDLFRDLFNGELETYGLSSVLIIRDMEFMDETSENGIKTDRFKPFKLAYADQVIVDLTYRFTKTDKCLLWKASSVIGCYPGKITEFYNFLTGGHGSFDVDFTKQPDDATTVNVAGVRSHFAQFHADIFMSAEYGPKLGMFWGKPNLQQSLTAFRGVKCDDVSDGVKPMELSEIMEMLDCSIELCTELQDLTQSRTTSDGWFGVNLTAIMRYTPNSPRLVSNEAILRTIYYKFLEEYPEQNVMSKIAEFPLSDMAYQAKTTMMVALKTMEPIIEDALMRRANEPIRLSLIPNFRNLQDVLVCEAILSFCLYGRMNVRSDGKHFAAPFYETLGLVPANFRNRKATFEGLRALRYINVTGETLSYVGPFFPTTYILDKGTEKKVNKDDPSTQR